MPPKGATKAAKVEVDVSTLPRVTGGHSVTALKAEARARGIKGCSGDGKDRLLEKLTCGSICLTDLPQFQYVEAVRALMESEASAGVNRAGHNRAMQQHRQVEDDKRERKEKERIKKMHQHTCGLHKCALAPTDKLPLPAGRECDFYSNRTDVATCEFCGMKQGMHLELPRVRLGCERGLLRG